MQDNFGFIVFCISIVAILVVAIRQNLFQDINEMMTVLRIGKHNVEYQLSPDRRRPLVIMDKEFGLRQLLPGFFNKLNQEDWQEFWDIIYGVHPLINFENKKLPSAQRNFNAAEIQGVLIKRYPEVFSGFDQEHWKMFWKEIYGIIDYKLQMPADDELALKQKAKAEGRLQRKMQKDEEKISETVDRVRKEIGK